MTINIEPVKPYKNDDIVISKTLLRNVVVGILILVVGFTVFSFLNSGLTHKKVRQVFFDKYWNKDEKVFDFNVDGVKQLKKDTYWVKVSYRLWEEVLVDKNGKIENDRYILLLDSNNEERLKELGLTKKFEFITYQEDLIYVKWDTGWFVEKKKK